jgi:hypothetical protein
MSIIWPAVHQLTRGIDRGDARHEDRDRREAKLSPAISEILDRDPSLIKRAARHVEILLEGGQGMASHDLAEWSSILSRYSRQRIAEFLVSDTPRTTPESIDRG